MGKNTLIAFVMASTSLVSAQSFGANLVCWNLYSKSGSKPVVTAHIDRDDQLSEIVINQPTRDNDDSNISIFNVDGLTTSAVVGYDITTKRSPYVGNQDFMLADGIRLILPKNLSSSALAQASFNAGATTPARQNGVLDVEGSRYSSEQGGDGYTRMHCVAR